MMGSAPEVLLVDDNPADIALVQEALAQTKRQSKISSVADGEQAVAFLFRRGSYANQVRPNLVILDLNLPKKDGRAVLKEVKSDADLRKIPVIIFSSSQANDDIAKSYQLGANCYAQQTGQSQILFRNPAIRSRNSGLASQPAARRRVMEQPTTQVLLIEDNPGDADLVRLRLVETKTPVEVSCVSRLSDGLASLTRQLPSVVLLDLNLPDCHGAETFRKVLEKAPHTPIVILSGQDDETLASKALHQGVQDYLVKGDFTSKHLERAMRYAVERQALVRSLEISRKQQLEFKNRFLSHVSHELRTPLTCIHQYVSLLLDGLAGPVAPEQGDHLKTVLKSVNQLHAMIRGPARGDSRGKRQDAGGAALRGAEELIHQAVAMMSPTAQEKIGIETGSGSRTPLIHADPDRVLEILINLMDNALKFTPADGAVVVKACMVETDPGMIYVSGESILGGASARRRRL